MGADGAFTPGGAAATGGGLQSSPARSEPFTTNTSALPTTATAATATSNGSIFFPRPPAPAVCGTVRGCRGFRRNLPSSPDSLRGGWRRGSQEVFGGTGWPTYAAPSDPAC